MFDPKHVADFVTFFRGLIAIGLAWLGWSQGKDGLGLAVWLLLINWTGDLLDGPITRRSRNFQNSWIGDHDLEVDITVSAGLLVYMLGAGYVDWRVTTVYLLFLVLIIWRYHRRDLEARSA